MRSYLTTDLLWIEPIAKHHGEWKGLLEALTGAVWAAVEEPLAIMIVYYDDHGLALAGLADKEGMKPLIKMSRMIAEKAKAEGIELHGHWIPGSWQDKLAVKNGFIQNGNGYHVLKVEK